MLKLEKIDSVDVNKAAEMMMMIGHRSVSTKSDQMTKQTWDSISTSQTVCWQELTNTFYLLNNIYATLYWNLQESLLAVSTHRAEHYSNDFG